MAVIPAQFWRSVYGYVPGNGAGSALANSTTLTDISPAPQCVLAANTLYTGQRLRLTAYGIFSTTGTPTLLIGGYYGGVAGLALAATTAITTGNNAASWPWRFEMDIYIRSTGTSGTAWCMGLLSLGTSLTAASLNIAPATQTQPVTINTTAANAITAGAQWGSANSSNTITCEDAYVELLS